MIPATSSRYFAAAAIMARAESFTVDGAWPSAQLIVASAVALLLAVLDHLKKLMVSASKRRPLAGPFEKRGDRGVSARSFLRRWRAGALVLDEIRQGASEALPLGVFVLGHVAGHMRPHPGLQVLRRERRVLHQHGPHAGIDVGLLRDILRGRAPRLTRRVGLRAAQPALQPAPDRLAEIAALQRA